MIGDVGVVGAVITPLNPLMSKKIVKVEYVRLE